MITVKDCEAFCDAHPGWVNELACRECLGMVQAYARAHEVTVCTNDVATVGIRPADSLANDHRLAA